jgi:hypothetical protein
MSTVDYSELSIEEVHDLAFYSNKVQAQREYMQRLRLLRMRELLEREAIGNKKYF